MRRVWWRIVPLMALTMLCAFIDRVNIGFAALTMNRDLGISNATFGLGVGFFAIGYALAAIPSTLLLNRFGARRWISLIAVAWGLCSAGTAFVTRSEELLAVRLLLGAAEAGFSPGVILYFSRWFPGEYRGRVLGSWFFIAPVGLLAGGPLSSALLSFDGPLGLAGWQWLFIIEAIPSVLLAVLVFCFLTDAPGEARWLPAAEKQWLLEQLAREQRDLAATVGASPVWQILASTKVWVLTAVNLVISTAGIGIMIFLPLIAQSVGFSIADAGLITAIAGAASALALPFWGAWSDRSRSREAVVAVACGGTALALLATALLLPSPWAVAPICVALIGFYGSLVAFWTLPSAFLLGAGAAAGIAFINLVGNFGMLTGPWLIGHLSDRSHSYSVGVMGLAAIAAIGAAALAARVMHQGSSIRKPGAMGPASRY